MSKTVVDAGFVTTCVLKYLKQLDLVSHKDIKSVNLMEDGNYEVYCKIRPCMTLSLPWNYTHYHLIVSGQNGDILSVN